MPALLTRTSIDGPTSAKTPATEASSSTSIARTVTGSFSSRATFSRSLAPGFRMVATTSWPCRASSIAVS